MAEKTFHSITLPGRDEAITARVPLTAAEFSPSVAYEVKDYCTYRGNLYRCTTAHAAGLGWKAAHFTPTDVDTEFDRKLDIPTSQASAPVNPRVGDLWIDTDENSPIYNVDASPTLGSTNAVQSGGTKVALNSLDSRKMEHGVITGDFSPSVDYRVGDLVFNSVTDNGITRRTLYRCITDHDSTDWNPAHFIATTLEVELQKIRDSEADTDMIGDLFGAKSIYAIGDYCVYNTNLYRCIRAIDNTNTDAPAFNENDWEQVKIANDINDLKSAFNSQTLYYDYMSTSGPTAVKARRIYTVRKTHIEMKVESGSAASVYHVIPLFDSFTEATTWSEPIEPFFSSLTYVPIDFDTTKWDLYLNMIWDHTNSSTKNEIFVVTKNSSTDEVTYVSINDVTNRVKKLNLFSYFPAIKDNRNFTLVFRSRNSGYPNNLDYSLNLEANSAVTDSITENTGKTMTLFYDIMSNSVSSEVAQRKFTVTKNKAKVEAVTTSPNSSAWLTVPLFGNFTDPLSLTDKNIQTVLQSCNFYSLNFDFLKSELFININWKNCYHQAPTDSARNEILIATKDLANSIIELSCVSNDSDYEITRYNLFSILPSIKKNNNFLLLFRSRNAGYTNEVYYSLELETKVTSISKDSKIVDFSNLFKLDAAFSNKDKKNLRYYSIKETPIQSLKIVLPEYQSGTGMPNIDNIRPYRVYSQDVEIYTSGHDKTNYTTRNLSFSTITGNILSGSFDIINGTFIRNRVWEILYPDNLPYIKFLGSSTKNRIVIASNLISTNRIKSDTSQSCSHASYRSSAGGVLSDDGMSLFHMYPNSRNIYFSVPGLTSREEYINYITELYDLGTPITFAAEIPEETLELFSKKEIRSVLGINNIWTNSQYAILSASFSTGIKTLCDFEKNDYQKQRPNVFQNGIIALRNCFNHIVWSDEEGLIKLNALDALINATPSVITPKELLIKQADEIIAIIDCLAHVAWADSDGFEYFSLLEEFTESEGIINLKDYDDVPYYNQRVLVFGNTLMLILDCIQHALWLDTDATTYYNIYNNIINGIN